MKALNAAILAVSLTLALAGCDVVYHSATVREDSDGTSKVRVVPVTAESVLVANRASYSPQTLPAVFSQTAGYGSPRSVAAPPAPSLDQPFAPGTLSLRPPPEARLGPYRVGIGDVLLLATPQAGSTVEELSGLLAAQNRRQGYTVQDDGTIAIPDVGRVEVADMTLEEAEAVLFQRLVTAQIDPTFSLEVAEFNSKKVSVGGAVGNPGVVPITLTPLYLDELLAASGGVAVPDLDYASIRIYRAGSIYQIPLDKFYERADLQRVQLVPGDSVFVDTEYDLTRAQDYFAEQIELANFRQAARVAALNELNTEVSLRRANLTEERQNFQTRQELGAVKRDYVYLTGEVKTQSRYALPFEQRASLADAIYDSGTGFDTKVADVRQIYVLRGSDDPREFGAVTAWQLDASNAVNLTLATRFELRPDDIIFIAEQPVTRWNRTISQILPSISVINQASNI